MPKISALTTEQTTIDSGADLLPIVDVSAGTTEKMKVSTLFLKLQDGTLVYAADSVGTDAYAITLAPVTNFTMSAYVTGMVFHFKAGTANTGACTLNVNSLGAKTIKKNHDQDLDSNDIEAGQMVSVIYDGTNFEMTSQLANSGVTLAANNAFTGDNTHSGEETFNGPVTFNDPVVMTDTLVAKVNLAEGQMLNGRISVTVASNDLTVALKTVAGTDPSASDPVYIMLNGAIRTVSAALSVTAADATNWFNSGSSELATKEIDYFAYIGYNSTDGVVIGFSRLPYIRQYGDFSATTTDEKYCRISTITTATSTDYYTVIGRFAATLSAGAAYTWTVPTFTAANLIQSPIYETRSLTWTPVWTGFSAGPTVTYAIYRLTSNRLQLDEESSAGTSNATGLTMTMPFKALRTVDGTNVMGQGIDNGTRIVTLRMDLAAGSATATFYDDQSASVWTGSGSKLIRFSHSLEI